MEDIYSARVLEEYKHPKNFGTLSSPTHQSKEANSCGDTIHMFCTVNNSVITEIKFSGKGCAISLAAASLLTEFVKGKTIADVNKLTENDMHQLLGITVPLSRKHCARLALTSLKEALEK
ncbi:MAG: iron-sulfur cluster assembly scaffold protein [Candidatus Woesearchaeota archaeon]|nr:MAG: iron-sulfur cluster assembly scaffold protein [Candidatus Woesearchaeota archaeon]